MAQCPDVYFWRQSLILFSDYLSCFGGGFVLSFPAVLNPAILSPNSTDLMATRAQASWVAGSQGITGIIGFLIMPAIMQVFGRKAAHYGINCPVSVGFIIFFFAKNITYLYIGRLVQGLGLSGFYISCIILAEYSAPRRRGYFISIKKSGVALGTLVCHSLSIICTWRQIALIGAIPNIFAIILTILWPESPAHLAMTGKFEECDASYTWLHGNSPQARKELEEVIAAQSKRRENIKDKSNIFKRILKNIIRKDFYKPFIVTTLLIFVIESTGKHYNLAYIVKIMTDIVKDNSIGIYCSLGSDIVTLVALWCSSFTVTRFNRRTILFNCGFASVTLMFLICLTIFLKDHKYTGSYLDWVPPCLIIMNSFITNLGVSPMCSTISGEIFPLEHRGLGTCTTGVVFTMVYGIVLKCTPLMIDTVGVEGTYGIYGLFSFICLMILYFILIETKDKTLQEIENEVKETAIRDELLIE